MRQRPQYLLAEFARAGHPVYFVDPREARPRSADGVEIVPNLAHVPRSGVLLYIHFAPLRTLVPLFDDPVLVYDILDDISIFEPDEVGLPPERRVAAHHPHLVGGADVCIVSNPVLAGRHREERPDLLLVENGVDVERFRAVAERPSDLPAGRIVGYHGAVAPWLDFELIAAVADHLPERQFVFVGPVHEACRSQVARLGQRPNVTFLGERASEQIAGYVTRFEVGTVWFVVNEMTEAVTPLKMYEYLAAGRPVVSTPLPACIQLGLVHTASSAEAFVEALRLAEVERADPDFVVRAVEEARQADWSIRVAPLLRRLDELERRRVPRG